MKVMRLCICDKKRVCKKVGMLRRGTIKMNGIYGRGAFRIRVK